jgi:hypothetical protein
MTNFISQQQFINLLQYHHFYQKMASNIRAVHWHSHVHETCHKGALGARAQNSVKFLITPKFKVKVTVSEKYTQQLLGISG